MTHEFANYSPEEGEEESDLKELDIEEGVIILHEERR